MNISFSPRQPMGLGNLSYSSNTINNNKNPKRHDVKNKNSIFKKTKGTCLKGNLKKNSLIETLMKQKSNLAENKNAFLERALKNGEDPTAIQKKLQTFDQQMQEIDEQISKIQLEEQRKSINNENKSKKNNNSNKTQNNVSSKDEQKDNSMDGLLSLSNALSQTEVLSSQKNLMSGKIRVLKCEIKLDGGRRGNPIRKRKQVAEIEDKLENITEKIDSNLKNINNNNIKNNSSNNVINKNKSIDNDSKIEKEGKSLKNEQQITKNIKNYMNNINDKSKYTGEEINVIA